jgi:hypothetical protein
MEKTIKDKRALEEVVRKLLANIKEQQVSTIVYHPEWYKKE